MVYSHVWIVSRVVAKLASRSDSSLPKIPTWLGIPWKNYLDGEVRLHPRLDGLFLGTSKGCVSGGWGVAAVESVCRTVLWLRVRWVLHHRMSRGTQSVQPRWWEWNQGVFLRWKFLQGSKSICRCCQCRAGYRLCTKLWNVGWKRFWFWSSRRSMPQFGYLF